MTVVLSTIAFFVVGYLVFLIPFSEAPELVFAIIAGLLAVVIVIGAVLIKKLSFFCEQYAADKASKKAINPPMMIKTRQFKLDGATTH